MKSLIDDFKSFSDAEIDDLINIAKPYQSESVIIDGKKYWYIEYHIDIRESESNNDHTKIIKRCVYGLLNSDPNDQKKILLDEMIEMFKNQL